MDTVDPASQIPGRRVYRKGGEEGMGDKGKKDKDKKLKQTEAKKEAKNKKQKNQQLTLLVTKLYGEKGTVPFCPTFKKNQQERIK